jgi:thioredoxin reductase
LERLDERPFPPGEYDVVVVGSGPGGLQTAYSLARSGIPRCAAISRDPAPGGMFRRFPVYQRLISWTKPDAPFERGTREYEWYDHNSLVGEEREHQALVPEFMDRAFDVPARSEMEAGLVEFAGRGGVRVRYDCEWLSTRRDDAGFVLGTSDGEYRCRVCVFAIGVTEPWVAPIPGLEAAPHYVDANAPERYQGKNVFIVGKRNSGFELAQGLLPWARRIVLGSPRPVDTAMLAFSPLSIRYLSPYTEHIRGGTGSYVVDAAIERVERHADGYRIHASGTTWKGQIELESDEVIAATGFRAPVRDLPSLGVTMINDGRMPAQNPYWESISVPGIYFAGNVMQASPGLRKHGATSTSGSVNGYRYNARVLAQYIAERHFGIEQERRALEVDEVVPYLLGELAHAPELWTQKGYLARVVGVHGADGIRDEGIVPLADFVDREGGGDACAVAVEYDVDGTIIPVVYVRRGGRLVEHHLPRHPLHTFGTDEHRQQVAECLAPLLSRTASYANLSDT